MKKLLIISSIILASASCSGPEPDLIEYKVSIFNQTTQSLIIEGYTVFNELKFEIEIPSGERGGMINYPADTFLGYRNKSDSIVTKFSNGKGYICADRELANSRCFNGRSPLSTSEIDFIILGNNSFEFVITQEDFDNAFELPN
jgi:hypothetical protein